MSELYTVVTTGRYQVNDIEAMQRKLEQTFKLSPAKALGLLRGKPVSIKKSVNASQAARYKKALLACGLDAQIEPADELVAPKIEGSDSPSQPVPRVATPAASPKPSQINKSAAEIQLAPAGARIGPRPSNRPIALPEIDHLQASACDRLAPPAKPGPAPPKVDHLQAQQVDRLAPITPSISPPPAGAFELASPGSRLSDPSDEPLLSIDISELEITKPESN